MKKILFVGIILIFIITAILIIRINIIKKRRVFLKQDIQGVWLSDLLGRASELETGGKFLDAKKAYQNLVNSFPNSAEVVNWQKKIEELNIKLLFSPLPTSQDILYEVKPQDTLEKIARKFHTTVELLMKSNGLTSDKIVPGEKLKVCNVVFSILVDKSQNTLILKTQEEIIKTYVVSTGKDNSTPTGTFKIVNKLENPTWFKAGAVIPAGSPENILGSRWLGFDLAGYGIHGTTEPQTLGKQVTEGCIRMSNSDGEELYTVVPLGTEVTIIN